LQLHTFVAVQVLTALLLLLLLLLLPLPSPPVGVAAKRVRSQLYRSLTTSDARELIRLSGCRSILRWDAVTVMVAYVVGGTVCVTVVVLSVGSHAWYGKQFVCCFVSGSSRYRGVGNALTLVVVLYWPGEAVKVLLTITVQSCAVSG
jgi:hypothetical protein